MTMLLLLAFLAILSLALAGIIGGRASQILVIAAAVLGGMGLLLLVLVVGVDTHHLG
jgi:hypothetical protein